VRIRSVYVYAPRHSRDVSNSHGWGLKGQENIKIIHYNVPDLDEMYVEAAEGYHGLEGWRGPSVKRERRRQREAPSTLQLDTPRRFTDPNPRKQDGRVSGVWQGSFVTGGSGRLQLESAAPGAFGGDNQRGD